MRYEKSLMAKWDEYAILKTAEDKGREEGIEIGIEVGENRKNFEFVQKLVLANFTVSKIANLASVSEDFVLEVMKQMK